MANPMNQESAVKLSNTTVYLLTAAIDSIPTAELAKKISSLTACQELWKRLSDHCSEFSNEFMAFLAEKVGVEKRIRESMDGSATEAEVLAKVNEELSERIKVLSELEKKEYVFEPTQDECRFMNEYWSTIVERLNLKTLGRTNLLKIAKVFDIKE